MESAEASSLATSSVDLITISQALHWFDFEKFYDEVKRVAKPGAVIAAFAYSMFKAEDSKLNNVIQEFYKASNPFWDEERSYIDEGYTTIPFPFEEIQAPSFQIKYSWSIEQILGYIETWSANQHYIKKFGSSLVTEDFKQQLQNHFSQKETINIHFPVYMRIGKVQ